ncbi:MAG TPA: hypothetical protein PLY87_08800 [Planctomycetaceae bacterium]|nr:hypothetical protein [Planctomycetaceae bacterium]
MERCILDAVDRAFTSALPALPPKFSDGQTRPKEVRNEWFRKENQGGIGSCNGAAWSGLSERVNYSSTGDKTTQLSKIWMYLMAQQAGGLLGSDNGSRPGDGGRVALDVGCCPEDLAPYTQSMLNGQYPGRTERSQIMSAANAAAAAKYKVAQIWRKPQSHAETLDLIGLSGGGWVYGITWYQGLIPADRVVREFNPRGKRILGGHALNALGYFENEDLEANNTHNDGPFRITPKAWEQILADSQTSVVGATGTQDARPLDWLNQSPWFD